VFLIGPYYAQKLIRFNVYSCQPAELSSLLNPVRVKCGRKAGQISGKGKTMHGIIFIELKKFVIENFGANTWRELIAQTTKRTVYLATDVYPDQEVVDIVTAASKALKKPIPDILEAFGEFIVPDLAKVYGSLIKPSWGFLDLLENTEKVMHTSVRLKNPGAEPPMLQCARKSPTEVVITYNSKRRMCALAKGIIEGLAKLYKQRARVEESSCMLKGDAQCVIAVTQY
jgi:predicted hydrocarbon binding protein